MLVYKHEQQYSFSAAETISKLINDSTGRNLIGHYFISCWWSIIHFLKKKNINQIFHDSASQIWWLAFSFNYFDI